MQLPETLTDLRQVVDPLSSHLAWLIGNRWALGLIGCAGLFMLAGWLRRRLTARYSFRIAMTSELRARLERSRVVIGDCTLYHEEAVFILPALHSIDAVATDPPYGIDAVGRGTIGSGSKEIPATRFKALDWDKKPVAPDLMSLVYSRARWQIIFGGNYYKMPPASCWLVWDKQIGGSFADCELAWTKRSGAFAIEGKVAIDTLSSGFDSSFKACRKSPCCPGSRWPGSMCGSLWPHRRRYAAGAIIQECQSLRRKPLQSSRISGRELPSPYVLMFPEGNSAVTLAGY